MFRARERRINGVVVGFLGLLSSVLPCQATPVTLTSAVWAFPGPECGTAGGLCVGSGFPQRGSASFDLEGGIPYTKNISEATATLSGPTASVQGETAGNPFPGAFAQALAEWSVAVMPVGAGLVLKPTLVPVVIQMSAEASASGSSAGAFASAESPFGSAQSCQSFGPTALCNGVINAVGITTFTGMVAPNTPIDLIVFAEGGGVGTSSFQASADPVLTVADELIPGTAINFRDAFAVALPAGVTQSLIPATADIPEPTSFAVLLTGLAGLAVRRVRSPPRKVR